MKVATRLMRCRSLLVATVVGALVATPVWGQVAAKVPEFDAVSIKPFQPDSDRMMIRMQMKPDGYSASGTSVRMLIQYAYDLKSQDQISGAGAVGDKRFNIEAKMDADTVAALAKLSPEERTGQQRLMMQALLADRFKMKAHRESKELPIFELVVAKGGPKLKETDPNAPPMSPPAPPDGMGPPEGMRPQEGAPKVKAGMMMMTPGGIKAQGVPVVNLANVLTMQLHRQVVDKTGLTGKYDIDLKFGPEDGRAGMMQGDSAAGAPGPVTTDSGPSIFTAIEEQLGLKLESTKGPVETVVVDHLELPSEN